MTDWRNEEYREELVSFLKTKVDDIVKRSQSLQVKFCSHFTNHLSSIVFVSFYFPGLSAIIIKLHVEPNRDHKKQIVVFRFFNMFSFWFFIYSFTYCTAYWFGAQRRHRYEETMQSLSWECVHGSTMKCCGMKSGKVHRIREYNIGWRGLCVRYAMSITFCHWFQHHILHFDRLGDEIWEDV